MQVLQGKTAIFGAFNLTLVVKGDDSGGDQCKADPFRPGCPCILGEDDNCCDVGDGVGEICQPADRSGKGGKSRRALKQIPPEERLSTLAVSPLCSCAAALPASATHGWQPSTRTPSPPTASLLSTATQSRHVKE